MPSKLVYVVEPHGATLDLANWSFRLSCRDGDFIYCRPEDFELCAKELRHSAHFVFWGGLLPEDLHGVKASLVYSEAMGGDQLPEHKAHFEQMVENDLPRIHRLIVHTPYMKRTIDALTGVDCVVAPVGLFERADLPSQRINKIAYFGSFVGKRTWLIPCLKEALGPVFRDFTGAFGPELDHHISGFKLVLSVHHSNVLSGSTWRMWQAAMIGCVPIVEMGGGPDNPTEPDLFPFSEEAFLKVPPIENNYDSLTALCKTLWRFLSRDVSRQQRALLEQARAFPFSICAANLRKELDR